MKATKVFVEGRELKLGKRIGSGGEGKVFEVANLPGMAVKLYLPNYVAKREAKVRAIVESRISEDAANVAFPEKVVLDEKGSFVGFLMKRVEKHTEIHELQTPSSRYKHFPNATYAFIVRVALNIARVFAQVHASGCVVGDVNQRGILVSTSGTVTLIDADSFQFCKGTKQYLCEVGVAEYTPPELQGRRLREIVRSTDHDAFGLAVCLFQLLALDRHPFVGRFTGAGEMPFERAIAEYRFAYSSRNTSMLPPPGSIQLSDFTPKVAQLFEASFSPANVGDRPTALTWVEALSELEKSLRVCSKNKAHFYARTSAECPWCRMEAQYGRPLFVNVDSPVINVQQGRFDQANGYVIDLQALLAGLNSVPVPTSVSVILPAPAIPSGPSPDAIAASSKQRLQPVLKGVALGLIFAGVVFFVSNISVVLAFALGGAGAWLFHSQNTDPTTALLSKRTELDAQLLSKIQELQRSSPIEQLVRRKAMVLDAMAEAKELSTAFTNVRSEYEKTRRQAQLESYLTQFALRGARINKLSSADISQLTSFGFMNALDVKKRDVTQVRGIGPVKANGIAAWVQNIEAKFTFRVGYTPEDQKRIAAGQNAVVTKQMALEENIKMLIEQCRQDYLAFERWRQTADPDIIRIVRALDQVEKDLMVLGASVPPRSSTPPIPVPQVGTYQKKQFTFSNTASSSGPVVPLATGGFATAVPNCPGCGRSMVRRIAHKTNKPFWGCSNYPRCTGSRSI